MARRLTWPKCLTCGDMPDIADNKESDVKEAVCTEYVEKIVSDIDKTQSLIEQGSIFGSYFNKAKCMYLAVELKKSIASLPVLTTDKFRPVLREIFFLVQAAKHLVRKSRAEKWLHEAFWMGDCTEAFGDVILDFEAAMDSIHCDLEENSNGSCRADNERAVDTTTLTYHGAASGVEWESITHEDNECLVSTVEQVVHHKSDLDTGKNLSKADLEIAQLLLDKLTGKLNHGEGMRLMDVKIVRTKSILSRKGSIVCIRWHGHTCVMKDFKYNNEATKEAAIMDGLTHPHIVKLIGVAYHKNSWALLAPASPKILLVYAEQGDLESRIANRHGEFTVDVIVDVMLQIAKGMHYIHSKKIVHLDLKSQNIFVATHVVTELARSRFFHVRIGDFGSAIRCDQPIPDKLYRLGTTRWRAPELFEKAPRPGTPGDVDLYKADVYSYAMVCFEVLTGSTPYTRECPSQGQGFYEYISAPNRPSLPEEYPPKLLSIIRSCWDADPTRRPSFEGVMKSLKDLKRELLLKDKFYADLLMSTTDSESSFNFRIRRQSTSGGTSGVYGGEDFWKAGMSSEGESIDLDLNDDDVGGAARTSPGEVDVDTVHPPFIAEGCEALVQLGEDVKRKLDDVVNGGATIGQHMFTSRLPHLQPILGEFTVHLRERFHGSNNPNTSMNVLLFAEVFRVLKKVEFFLAGCTWPALGFACGPTVTDEGFASLWRDVQVCVHMVRYCSPQPENTSYEDVSNFVAEMRHMNCFDDHEDGPWRNACLQDRQKLLQFCGSIGYFLDRKSMPSIGNYLSYLSWEDLGLRHRYLGSVAVISDVPGLFQDMQRYGVSESFVEWSEQIYWGQGPESMVLGPCPFLPEMTLESFIDPSVFHQPAVYWAVKVYACESRKMVYEFRQLASLQHPHVVQVFGHWEDGKSGYVAMKLMQANLAQFLSQKQEQMLSPLFLVGILHQIAEGMSYLHGRLVRHHNLKCSNVLVGGCYEGLELAHVEVADFGFQRQQRSEGDVDSESSGWLQSCTTFTKDQIEFGEGEETDEYAFDVYLYAMLCLEIFSFRGSGKQIPVRGAIPQSSKVHEAVPAQSSPEILFSGLKCPGDLALFFQRCATKNPAERPKFPEICTTLRNHEAYMILTGNQGV